MKLIPGIWDEIIPVCARHETEEIMVPQQGPSSIIYTYPKYKKENRVISEGVYEDPCLNYIPIKDYQEMVEKISDELASQKILFQNACLTGMRWKKNGISFEVISHEVRELRFAEGPILNDEDLFKEKIKVRILNRTIYREEA